jgi:hypothetical protein
MILFHNFLKRLILFIFYFDLGFTYFITITLYRNFLRLKLYLFTKNKLIKFYVNLKSFNQVSLFSVSNFPTLLYYYILELFNNFLLIIQYLKINFLAKLKQDILRAPALEIYYPLKTSIFSVTLRITGVFLTLGLGLFYLICLIIIF